MSNNGNWQERQSRRDEQESRALAILEPTRMPLLPEVAKTHNLTESKWRALTESVWPSAKTQAGVMMALDYCTARNLDPFKRPVHIVPMYHSKLGREVETVWPGIGELRTTAHRTGQWAGTDGAEFGRVIEKGFSQKRERGGGRNSQPSVTTADCPEMKFPEWAQVTVWKIVHGVRCPFVGPKVYFEETFSGQKGLRVPNERWQQAPRQMLEKCAEAAALRRAFPEEIGEQLTAEEMEGKIMASNIPHAEYAAADASDDRGGGATMTREERQQDQTDDDIPEGEVSDSAAQQLRDEVESFMEEMEAALASVKTIKALERGLAGAQQMIDSLPDEERERMAELESAARARIGAAKDQRAAQRGGEQQHRDEDGVEERQQDGAPPAGEPGAVAEEPATAAGEPYLEAFKARLAKIDLVLDLNTLENETFDELEAQPEAIADECRALLQAKRDQLQPRKR